MCVFYHSNPPLVIDNLSKVTQLWGYSQLTIRHTRRFHGNHICLQTCRTKYKPWVKTCTLAAEKVYELNPAYLEVS